MVESHVRGVRLRSRVVYLKSRVVYLTSRVSHHASPGTAAHHVFHWMAKCKGKRGKKVLPRFQPCLKSALSSVSTELYLRNKKDGFLDIVAFAPCKITCYCVFAGSPV